MNANRIVTGLNSDIGLRRASNQDNALAGHPFRCLTIPISLLCLKS